MSKLLTADQTALQELLKKSTAEQRFEVMKQALNAFAIHACKEEPEVVKEQYGTMIHPMLRDMVALEAFHTIYRQQVDGRTEDKPDAEQ